MTMEQRCRVPTRLRWLVTSLTLGALVSCQAGTPAEPHFFNQQLVHHHGPLEDAEAPRWTQRYYTSDDHFAGPGSPIFVILGGEGAIEPSTGLLYPFVTEHLAPHFGAYVLQPEHRFYGASQPLLNASLDIRDDTSQRDARIGLLTYEQALLDAMSLIELTRIKLQCSSDRTSTDYCPVITVGGSYPGFLSAMARIMFPAIVDMAYAASAPILLYAQTVSPEAYYQRITNVADTAVPHCAAAVQATLSAVHDTFKPTLEFGACPGTVPAYCRTNVATLWDELHMMVAYTFANDNMAFYPPSRPSRLHTACDVFLDDTMDPVARLRHFLVSSLGTNPKCFNMSEQLPTGRYASISGGDWSGIGTGGSGDSWDFQTCTLCIEAIGFNSTVSMFLDRPWSLDWLTTHCQRRFPGVVPRPWELRDQWHLDDLRQTGGLAYSLYQWSQ